MKLLYRDFEDWWKADRVAQEVRDVLSPLDIDDDVYDSGLVEKIKELMLYTLKMAEAYHFQSEEAE
jgi:hypothetical protein